MKKSIYLIVGAVLLLCHLSSAESLPSHARRSSVFAAVGGSCTRYSCATNKGFGQCLLEEGRYTSMASYTHEELKALLKIKRQHPNCYKSFCIANCMTPPGIEEKPIDKSVPYCPEGNGDYFLVKKRSDLCGKISKLKDKKRNSYIEKMDQFMETKIENCTQGDHDELKGLGGILRRMCYFCGPLLGAEGYSVIRACKARNGDFPKDVEQRIGQLSKRDGGTSQTNGGAFQLLRQVGVNAVTGWHAQGSAAFNQARGYAQEQGSAAFNQARGYAQEQRSAVVNQGRALHNLAQGHVKKVSSQGTRARKGALTEFERFSSGLMDDVSERKGKLTREFDEFKKAARNKEEEIKRGPREYQRKALQRLEKRKRAYEEKFNEQLRALEESMDEGDEEGVGEEDVDFEGI